MQTSTNKKGGRSCLGCLALLGACLFTTLIALVGGTLLFREQIVGFGLQATGFNAEGNTNDILAASAPVIPPAPAIQNAAPPQTFSMGTGSTQSDFSNNQGVEVIVGDSNEGRVASLITNEDELLRLCLNYSAACGIQGISEGGVTIRNLRFDLKPGGAVLNGEVEAQNFPISQPIGLVMQVNNAGDQLVVRGIDIGGTLYSSPPAELATLINRAETEINNAITQATLNAGGENFQLDRIILDENTLTVVMK